MLDAIKKAAAEFLGITLKEVRETQEALHAEVASEDGRYAARTQLTHPEGSSTPLNEAADSAQQAFAKTKEKLEAALPGVMKLFIAYEVAQQRRDEAVAARDKHWDAEMTRRASGVHPKVDEFFRRLFTHGVTPHTIFQHRDEDVAIMADLHRWKAKDPLYKHPDNPWRGVYGIYANRMIAVPGGGRTVNRSVLGTPVRTRRYAADKWYMFNEIAADISGVPVVQEATNAPPVDPLVTEALPIAKAAPASQVTAVPTPLPSPSASSIASLSTATSAPANALRQPTADAHTLAADEVPAREIAQVAAVVPVAVAVRVADSAPTIDQPQLSRGDRAREMAETAYIKRIGVYWPPKGVDRDDYSPEKLIPALEEWIANGTAWPGAVAFLEAARDGRAREFIEDRRESGTRLLTTRLLAGDEQTIFEARAAGCQIELLAVSPLHS